MLYIWAVDYKISPQITLNTNLVANIQVIFFGGKFHHPPPEHPNGLALRRLAGGI